VLSIGPAIYAWQWPTPVEWLLLIGVGVLGAMAQSFWIRSFRAGDASVVAPFDYMRLLFAGFIGFAVFAELPTMWTLIGAGVIVTSTLYIAHREAQIGRTATPDAPRR
jgi:drug/metabolite transporter (DMT)-like permease